MPTSSPSTTAAVESDLERIARFNDTATPFPGQITLSEIISARLQLRGSETVVVGHHDPTLDTDSLTGERLELLTNQLAHRLRSYGIQPGHVVAVMVERSFSMIIGLFGILKAGAAYLPVSPDHPPERIEYLLNDGGAKALLVQNKTYGRIDFRGPLLNLDEPETYRESAANPGIVSGPEDLAYVIHTSGSTGRPKGVMIEQHSVVNRLHWMQGAYPLGPGDVILQKTPFFFDVSVWEFFWWTLAEARLCLLKPGGEGNPLAIADTIRKHRVTVLHFVPSMLNTFLEYFAEKPEDVRQSLASVRQVFASGEALTPGHVRKFNRVWGDRTGARLTNLYGPTEATVDVTFFDCPPHGALDVVPIGRPIQNTRIHILRDDRVAPIGETGELCIAGVGLARGYLNNPELTAGKFNESPAVPGERVYRTGDLARWRPDGNIEYLGREDHQVKIRGLRIELGEIENAISEYPGIRDCVVRVRQCTESIVLIIAHVVCNAGLEVEGLRSHLKKKLPDYMIPHRFEELARLPLTPTGKVDRQALADADSRV